MVFGPDVKNYRADKLPNFWQELATALMFVVAWLAIMGIMYLVSP